jgi:serine O-acetyltransferase
VFGPGLSIAHWGTIVVNDKARVGFNCRIHPGSCIGERDGLAPRIGNDCYVGPGAVISGPITLGDNVKVGANAVVTKSFGSDITLVGAPARPTTPSQQAVAALSEKETLQNTEKELSRRTTGR